MPITVIKVQHVVFIESVALSRATSSDEETPVTVSCVETAESQNSLQAGGLTEFVGAALLRSHIKQSVPWSELIVGGNR